MHPSGSRNPSPLSPFPAEAIQVDRDGNWIWQGRPMVHERILPYLKRYLRQDAQGQYWIRLEAGRIPVDVADSPYVVLHFDAGPPARVHLDSGGRERLSDPLLLMVGDGHRLYTLVRGARHRALLSRAAHQQVWDTLERDETGQTWMTLGGVRRRVMLTGLSGQIPDFGD
jgi:hypothetical protein